MCIRDSGTTTATVLAQAIVAEGLKNVTAGASPMDIKRGSDKAVAKVVESIKSQAETVGDNYDKIEPVSYTHLDVYKRQVHGFRMVGIVAFRSRRM